MDPLLYYSLLSLTFILTLKLLLQKINSKNLPPNPLLTLPIIGNLHNINLPLHRSLHNLSQKYGDIFTLWFGSRRVVVISSQTLLQQCLTKHDVVLSNRPRFLVGKHFFYNYTSLDSVPYGDHSRNLRRVVTVDVLSTQRLNSFTETRRKEALNLIIKLAKDTCEGFTRVELKTRLTNMTFEIMTRMVAGEATEGKKFKDLINEMMPLLGASNQGDFVPLIRLFDFKGVVKRMKDIGKRGDSFVQGIVDEIRSGKHGRGNNMVQHLLTLQKSQPEYYSDVIIKGLIQGMFLGGTDTSAVTLERACPGLGLAHRTMGLSLGLLIQCFEWKRLTQEKVDMTESKIGLVMEKHNPLEIMCKARPIIKKVIQELNI
ncbi:hypothetical protein P8452_38863 [Trifolium repens]|nr:hypothetical protein P8452_38863 [Trifolium repens]